MNNNQNNNNQPNVQPNLGNSVSYDNRLVSNNQPMPIPSPQPMPATAQQPMPAPIPNVAPDVNPVPIGQVQPAVQQPVPAGNNLTGTPVQPSEPKNGGGGKGIIIIVLIIVIVIAVVGFFIGKNMIDSENSNNNTITDKKAKDSDDDNERKIDYNGVLLYIPNGYEGKLNEDSGVLFKNSGKAYSIDFYDETVGDLDSSLIQMGAASKGNKKISGIEFNLYSYTKANKTEIIYVVDTSTFRIMGFAANSSFVYNEKILNDVITTLGGSSDAVTALTPSSAVKPKFSSKVYSTIYEFEE